MRELLTSLMSARKIQPNEATPIMWMKYVWNKVHRLQFNFNTIVTGDTGTGKTLFAVTIAYLLNQKRFNARFYTNSVKEFLEIVEDKKTRKGDTIVFDETGANLSAREWYTIGNILAGQALQTYRRRNLCVFFCTPDPSFTDVQLRRLLNCFIVMKRYDVDQSFADIRKVKVDRMTSKTYWPQFTFFYEGKNYKISRIKLTKQMINLVPKKILDEIDEKDKNFKNKVLAKAMKQADIVEHARLGIDKTPQEMAEEILKNPERFSTQHGNIDWKLVSADFDLSRDRAQTVVSLVRRQKR